MKRSWKPRKQLDAASERTKTSQKGLERQHGARNTRGTATYAIVQKQPLITTRQENNNYIFFIDAFPDTVELDNLIRECGDSACKE